MSGDLVLLVAGILALALGHRAWDSALGAREAANRIARDACSRAVVEFLDGTVAFAGFRLRRAGRLELLRTYTFDYSTDGFDRAQGFVIMAGERVEAVGLAGAPA
jgi:Protein of unknown function (DUF3301)